MSAANPYVGAYPLLEERRGVWREIARYVEEDAPGVRTLVELGAVMAVYGGKAVAAGLTAAMSAALAFLTMPFKGVQANSLKVGK